MTNLSPLCVTLTAVLAATSFAKMSESRIWPQREVAVGSGVGIGDAPLHARPLQDLVPIAGVHLARELRVGRIGDGHLVVRVADPGVGELREHHWRDDRVVVGVDDVGALALVGHLAHVGQRVALLAHDADVGVLLAEHLLRGLDRRGGRAVVEDDQGPAVGCGSLGAAGGDRRRETEGKDSGVSVVHRVSSGVAGGWHTVRREVKRTVGRGPGSI
jgi:hypothetical protein